MARKQCFKTSSKGRRQPTRVARPVRTIVQRAVAQTPTGYGEFLNDLKVRIRAAQIKASLSVNRELIELYWSIGRDIVQRQQAEGWGKGVVDRLAGDLQKAFPGISGFSAGNIWRMRAFHLAWTVQILARPARVSDGAVLAQPVRELVPENLPRPVSEIPCPSHFVAACPVWSRSRLNSKTPRARTWMMSNDGHD